MENNKKKKNPVLISSDSDSPSSEYSNDNNDSKIFKYISVLDDKTKEDLKKDKNLRIKKITYDNFKNKSDKISNFYKLEENSIDKNNKGNEKKEIKIDKVIENDKEMDKEIVKEELFDIKKRTKYYRRK